MAEDDPGKALKAKSLEEFAKRTKGKPTPTQEENDRAAMGEFVVGSEHEADGADPDEGAVRPDIHGRMKQSEAKPGSGGGYQTRQATPRPPTTS